MDKETIQQIASEVVARLPYGDRYWLFLLVNVVVMAAVGALAALGTSYFRTRGQNFATKHDFDELQKQLKANTELVETIKSDVGQKDWAKREWTNLRRTKLEALLDKMHDCEVYLDVLRDKCVAGEEVHRGRDPFSELDTIAALYFRELRPQVDNFVREGRTQATAAFKLRHARMIEADQAVVKKLVDEFYASLEPVRLMRASDDLKAAARRLLVDIMGVED
jgi:hypothetical protein